MNFRVRIQDIAMGLTVALACSSIMGQPLVTATVSGDGGITDVTGTVKPVHPAATGAAGGYTFDLFLDSASDILVIDATLSGCLDSVFNDTNPAHVARDDWPPIPALMAVFGDLHADLWIRTPSVTNAVDPRSLTAGESVSRFDTTDDGPQSDFHWASLTLLPDEFGAIPSVTLDATVQTAAAPWPKFDTVAVTIGGIGSCVPEPSSLSLVGFALLGCVEVFRRKRSSTACQF